jgi:hypothetical protein
MGLPHVSFSVGYLEHLVRSQSLGTERRLQSIPDGAAFKHRASDMNSERPIIALQILWSYKNEIRGFCTRRCMTN